MKRNSLFAAAPLLLLLLLMPGAVARSQATAVEKCEGPVYESKEVSRRAVLTSKPAPGFTDEARNNNVCGTMRLSAVFCRTGRVTDIEVVNGLPHGLTEKAVEAIKRVTFTPAEKDGRPASQRIKVEYSFYGYGSCGESRCLESPTLCAGRLVEEVQVEGNRRRSDEALFNYIQTRPGNPFNPEQAQRDLQTLLDLPFFDKMATRLTVADGARGGIVVIFTVMELPIIRDLTFTGLKSVSEADVLRAFRENRVGLSKEAIYDPVKVKRAERVIKELLALRGRPYASVQVSVEHMSSQSVALEFVIDEGAKGPPAEQELLRPPRRKLLQTPQVARASQTGVEIGTE